MKYLLQFFPAFIASIILLLIVTYFTNNLVAGIGIFTASLVSIQFLLNRYENRIDTEIEVKISKIDTKNELIVSIINKGGKTLYLKSGGIFIKDGLTFDFDDKIKYKKTTQDNGAKVEKTKSATRMSVKGLLGVTIPIIPKIEMPEMIMPDMSELIWKPFFPTTLNPGQSKTIYRDVKDILSFLAANNWKEPDIYFKGFFKDQLNREYASPDYLKYSMRELFDLVNIN
jgi:hypothetical protein